MKRHIKSAQRHFNDYGWLKTFWLFSFSHYHDPDNVSFGSLRVFNDDVVEAGQGFPTHPHEEMEIVTIVLDGQLSHADSMGNSGDIGPCEVQRMSAGTGLTHSEYNNGATPIHFYQIWLHSDQRGLKPSYEQRCFSSAKRRNTLVPVASGQGASGAILIHVDATIFLSDLEAGQTVSVPREGNKRVFIYVQSGVVTIDGERLETGDQLRVAVNSEIHVKAVEDASFTLIALGR